jgi:hypothetical protein
VSPCHLTHTIASYSLRSCPSTFTLEYSSELPLALIGFIRLLLLSDSGWVKAKDKGKVPKPKISYAEDGAAVVDVLNAVLNKRLSSYGGTLEVSSPHYLVVMNRLDTAKQSHAHAGGFGSPVRASDLAAAATQVPCCGRPNR